MPMTTNPKKRPARASGGRAKQPLKDTAARSSEDEVARTLERELDQALEQTFPASDPIAVDSLTTHKARHDRTRPKR
jgi:hypothetical protein